MSIDRKTTFLLNIKFEISTMSEALLSVATFIGGSALAGVAQLVDAVIHLALKYADSFCRCAQSIYQFSACFGGSDWAIFDEF